jgi:hypothetical protein
LSTAESSGGRSHVGSEIRQGELLLAVQAINMTVNKSIDVERMRDVMVGLPFCMIY